jgi:hypothetical protein
MDEPNSPTPGARLSLEAAGEAWSWRLITPDGRRVAGLAPDASAARRSAAFAAGVVGALGRAQQRRF